MGEPQYDSLFYESINRGSRASASLVLPVVRDLVGPRSVVDFGCGQGVWLDVWRGLGVTDVVGVDDAHVDRAHLKIPTDAFVPRDLSAAVHLGRRFDLVQTLEVAEHLPDRSARTFVRTLTRHGAMILFSAAVPGQGGTNHVNERPREWWRTLFRDEGYVVLDPIRPRIATERGIMPWYRYNLLLYVDEATLRERPDLDQHRIPERARIPDYSPLWYKLRKVAVARLPLPVANLLARSKVHLLTRFQRSAVEGLDEV